MLVPLTVFTAPLFKPPRFSSALAWGVVLYQAILGALAHIGWYEGVRAVGSSRSAMFMNFQPVVGVLLAAVLLRESIGVAQLVGGVAVLTGVALTTRSPSPSPTQCPSPLSSPQWGEDKGEGRSA